MIRSSVLCLLLPAACACSASDAPESPTRTPASAVARTRPAAPIATTPTAEGTAGSASADLLAALQALNTLDTTSPDVARLLQTHFKDSCQPDERMPFDAICQAYGANDHGDPSPWPDVLLGLRDGRIASVVAIARDASLNGWTCETVTVPEPTQACYPPATPEADRVRWTQQWSAFFSSAD